MGRLGRTLLVLLASLPALAVAGSIRGLDPKLAPRYQPTVDGEFACLDGKKTIPFEQVNDDYCDCLDGSDEPGTSACANGHFYCENKFFLPLLLNASMVDDGVCDCCDGSDEPAGRCPNDCYTKGYESLAELKQQAVAAEKGVAVRAQYVSGAADSKKQWAERKAQVEAEVEQRRKEKERLEADKSQLEEEERKLRDKKNELEQQQKKKAEEAGGTASNEEEQAAGEEQAAEHAEHAEHAGGEEVSEHAGGEEVEHVGDDEGAGAFEEAAEDAGAAEHKSEEELARERMAQWIPGSKDDAAGATEEEAAGHEEEPEPIVPYDPNEVPPEHDGATDAAEDAQFFRDDGSDGVDGGAGGGDDGAGGADGGAGTAGAGAAGGVDEAAGEEAPASAFGKAKRLLSKIFSAMTAGKAADQSDDALTAEIAKLESQRLKLEEQLTPMRNKASEARNKVSELEKELKDLTSKLQATYGEGDAFVALVGRCFEAKVDKYTYEVCPYSKASQKEGGSSTSLGSWGGLEENDTRMAFRNGQHCWGGPDRSMTVSLKCGQTERLARVEEPSRCEYTAELETPAACTAATAETLRGELAARERFLQGGGDPAVDLDDAAPPAKDEL